MRTREFCEGVYEKQFVLVKKRLPRSISVRLNFSHLDRKMYVYANARVLYLIRGELLKDNYAERVKYVIDGARKIVREITTPLYGTS